MATTVDIPGFHVTTTLKSLGMDPSIIFTSGAVGQDKEITFSSQNNFAAFGYKEGSADPLAPLLGSSSNGVVFDDGTLEFHRH